MPLPIGHTAIGLAAAESVRYSQGNTSRLAQFAFITVLANLPDIDMIIGLLLHDNGTIFHRGPTHSLLFSIVTGYLASRLWRLWHRIPRFGFQLCTLLIFSHVAADMLLTSAPVSLLWPFESYQLPGHSGWGQVLHAVLFQSIQDLSIVLAAIGYLLILRLVRARNSIRKLFALARRRAK